MSFNIHKKIANLTNYVNNLAPVGSNTITDPIIIATTSMRTPILEATTSLITPVVVAQSSLITPLITCQSSLTSPLGTITHAINQVADITTANITTANITTSNETTANITTANIGTNISNMLTANQILTEKFCSGGWNYYSGVNTDSVQAGYMDTNGGNGFRVSSVNTGNLYLGVNGDHSINFTSSNGGNTMAQLISTAFTLGGTFAPGLITGNAFNIVGGANVNTGFTMQSGHVYIIYAGFTPIGAGASNAIWYGLALISFLNSGYNGYVNNISTNNVTFTTTTGGNIWCSCGGSGSYQSYITAIRLM